ncbi:MAG: NADH-quinone oxidoreductase subunit J [Candidatus Omnitrophota bacterium]|nr:NADH-quinone oxidoreductase subunit J [Candidatus Omnitrophota bacterium]
MNGLIQLLNSVGLPQEIIIKATFYPIACLILIFALLVVMSRDIFHSALYLAFVLLGVACVYLYLDAEFLAVVQVLIYVGAIVTLFIFTIMLTADINTGPRGGIIRRMLVSAFATLSILFIFIKVIVRAGWQEAAQNAPAISLEGMGISLMSKYVLPFEVISLISLAALVGAIVIGKGRKR